MIHTQLQNIVLGLSLVWGRDLCEISRVGSTHFIR